MLETVLPDEHGSELRAKGERHWPSQLAGMVDGFQSEIGRWTITKHGLVATRAAARLGRAIDYGDFKVDLPPGGMPLGYHPQVMEPLRQHRAANAALYKAKAAGKTAAAAILARLRAGLGGSGGGEALPKD